MQKVKKENPILLQADHIRKTYGEDRGKKIVLDDLNLTIHEGEFVALLGPSGSGKSTFLRILSGLIPPTNGNVLVHGTVLNEPNPFAAIVFQTFALYPWLTVEQNVALGLLSHKISGDEKEKRISDAIHLIGLHGFEHAYPKEISGGMKQRVGFARALVVQPEILMMDEPFSALDVLTSENLRHELLTLWLEKKIPTKAILMVTHNIDEAVSMADRLLILSTDPGKIRIEIPGLPVINRTFKDDIHNSLVSNIYRIMTNPHESPKKLIHGITEITLPEKETPYQIIPQMPIHSMKGFLKRISAKGGKEELQSLENTINIDQMLSLTALINILGFGGIEGSTFVLTEIGKEFVSLPPNKAREIFKKQVLENMPLLQFIVEHLQTRTTHSMLKHEVLLHLEKYFPPHDAEIQFRSAIDIGRYAELFIYRHVDERIIATSTSLKNTTSTE